MTILIIDDEVQIRRLLRLAMESKGHTVREAENGTLGLQAAVFQRPDVIVLDLGLPDMEGSEVLKRLREWSSIPVPVLSVRDQETVKLAAFDIGADDYVTKPFSTAELLARLAAIQRQQHNEDMANPHLGPLILDPVQRTATLFDEPLKLTPTEYALLTQLAKHAGKVVTIKHLLRAVWGPQSEQQSNYLRVYANHLRKKLEGSGLEIQNEPGIGYRMMET